MTAGTARLQTAHRLVVALSSMKSKEITLASGASIRPPANPLAAFSTPRYAARDECGGTVDGGRAARPRDDEPVPCLQECRAGGCVGNSRGRGLDAQEAARVHGPARGTALRPTPPGTRRPARRTVAPPGRARSHARCPSGAPSTAGPAGALAERASSGGPDHEGLQPRLPHLLRPQQERGRAPDRGARVPARALPPGADTVASSTSSTSPAASPPCTHT